MKTHKMSKSTCIIFILAMFAIAAVAFYAVNYFQASHATNYSGATLVQHVCERLAA